MERLVRVARQSARVIGYVFHHPANREHRYRALGRAVRFQLRGRVGDATTLTPVGRSMVMAAPLHATGASKAVYANPPDWPEMQTWRRLLNTGDLFVDVGSNAGLYSLWAADCGATPIAIEPDPVNARRTRDNLARNGVAGEVHECAAADETGVMELTLGQDTVNHLVRQVDDANSDKQQRTQRVQVRPLDDIIAGRHVRGIKIDVEGAERLVLKGCRAVLAEQRVDVLQIEWNRLSQDLLGESRQPLARLLSRHGYVLCRPDDDFALRHMGSIEDFSDQDVFAVSAGCAPTLVSQWVRR